MEKRTVLVTGASRGIGKAIATLLEKHDMNVTMPFAGHDTAFIAKINEGKKRKAAILVERLITLVVPAASFKLTCATAVSSNIRNVPVPGP